jgi:hypothetical protein
MVYELSGESRLRSMVRESSMELKPAALSKGGGLYRLRLAPLLVWGRVLQPKVCGGRGSFFRRLFRS